MLVPVNLRVNRIPHFVASLRILAGKKLREAIVP
jgi:hypothetical protein